MVCNNNTSLDYLISSVIMLFLLMDLSWCRPAQMYGQESCKPEIMSVSINLTGCEPLKVRLFGCAGYCRSDTTINLDDADQSLIPSCSCCKPLSDVKFSVAVNCPKERDGLRNVELVSAKECSCTPCLQNQNSVDPSAYNS